MPSDAEGTRLWFMRHGEVEAGKVGAFNGRTDCGLSQVGHHQAAAIAAYLEEAPIDAIVSSPRRRALDTGAPLARARGVKLDVRAALAEMDFGAWDGLHWQEIVERDADQAITWQRDIMGLSPPGGETGRAFMDRVTGCLDALLAEYKGRTLAIAGHAGVSRAILAHALELPYEATFRFAQDYGCLNACGWVDGFAQVALLNFVPGPKSHDQGDGGPQDTKDA